MRSERGFSAIEIIIVVVILVIVMGISVAAYSSFLNAQRLNSAVEGTISVIQKARESTLSSKDTSGGTGKQYGVRFNDKNAAMSPNSVQLYEAPPPFTIEVEPRFDLPGGVQIDSVSIMPVGGNQKDIYFDRLSGNVRDSVGSANASASIVIKSLSSSAQKTITISQTGVVEVQ